MEEEPREGEGESKLRREGAKVRFGRQAGFGSQGFQSSGVSVLGVSVLRGLGSRLLLGSRGFGSPRVRLLGGSRLLRGFRILRGVSAPQGYFTRFYPVSSRVLLG